MRVVYKQRGKRSYYKTGEEIILEMREAIFESVINGKEIKCFELDREEIKQFLRYFGKKYEFWSEYYFDQKIEFPYPEGSNKPAIKKSFSIRIQEV